MLKLLVRVRLAAIKSALAGGSGSKPASKGKIFGLIMLFVYTFAAAGLGMWKLFDSLAKAFFPMNVEWAYFTVAAIFSFGLMFIGTVLFAKAQLFEAKDNDLLMSMPISGGDIYLSRMILLLVIAAIFDLPAVIPAMIAWIVVAGGGLWILYYWLVFIALVFFALALSSVFGFVVSYIVSHVRRKALVGTVLCVVLIGAYSAFIAKLNTTILDAAMVGSISGKMGAVAPLLWLGKGIAEGNVTYLLLTLVILLGFSLVTYLALSRCYIRLATMKKGGVRVAYDGKVGTKSSPEAALLRKEFARLGSSAGYMVNAGLGVLFTLVCAGALFVKRSELGALSELAPELWSLMPYLLTLGLCFMLSMCFFSAPSVSLEGKNLWIVRTSPVKTGSVLMAKLKVHLYICLPTALLSSLLCVLAIKPGIAGMLAIIIIPLQFTLFSALLGLAENLRYPKLNWTNETQAVKSSMSVLYAMLICWGLFGAVALAYYLTDGVQPGLIAWGFALVLAAASAWLYRWIMSRGCELFEQL